MTTAPEEPPPPRGRPTVALVRTLERSVSDERRRREQAEAHARYAQAERDKAVVERDAEGRRWEEFDAEALALGRLVGPLGEYAGSVRGGRWSSSSSDQTEIDDDIAAAVARVLVAVGGRFGVRLMVDDR